MGWFKKLLRLLAIIIMIIVIVVALYLLIAQFVFTAASAGNALGLSTILIEEGSWAVAYWTLALMGAFAFFLDPAAAGMVMEKVGDAIGDMASAAVGAIAHVIGDAIDKATEVLGLDTLLMWALGGYIGYKIVTAEDSDPQPETA
jgi:hypothetical protein